MAIIDSPSPSSWSEIKGEINSKALNKEGDTVIGDIIIDDETGRLVTDKIIDSGGKIAIENDAETETLSAYGTPINRCVFSASGTTFEYTTSGTFEVAIPINYPAKRALVTWKDAGGSCDGFFIVTETPGQNRGVVFYHGGTGGIVENDSKIAISRGQAYITAMHIQESSIIIQISVEVKESGNITFNYMLF